MWLKSCLADVRTLVGHCEPAMSLQAGHFGQAPFDPAGLANCCFLACPCFYSPTISFSFPTFCFCLIFTLFLIIFYFLLPAGWTLWAGSL